MTTTNTKSDVKDTNIDTNKSKNGIFTSLIIRNGIDIKINICPTNEIDPVTLLKRLAISISRALI